MIEGMSYSDRALFTAQPGWVLFNDEQRSLFDAFLRRSEDYQILNVLNYLGNVGPTIDAPSIMPAPPIDPPSTSMIVEEDDTPPPLNIHNAVPVIIPPGGDELVRLREIWDREWKRKQRDGGGGSGGGGGQITLTPEEIQIVTHRARQRSAEVSGHGRKAHGGYASSSSPSTLAADQERSRNRAIEKALRQALARKTKGEPV